MSVTGKNRQQDEQAQIRQEQNSIHVSESEFSSLDYLNEEEPEEAVDERWLISYSDMMTLLFGLFVMLYAIAMETQGRPEKYFNDLAGKKTVSGSKSSEKQLINGLKDQISSLNSALLSANKNLEHLNSQKADTDNKLKGLLAQSESYKSTISQLQGKLDQFQLQKGKQLPSGNEDRIKNESAILARKIENQNQEIAQLKQQLAEVPQKMSSFMVILLKWETEKHDLDLVVTDPEGKSYNFENRSFQGKNGKIVIDSRSGPGVELWETPVVQEGRYQIQVLFYNSYGNKTPAKVSGTIITQKGEFPLTNFNMDFTSSKAKKFIINVTKSGDVVLK